ncbi:uncharacterized protein MAL13P1.304-like [Aphidius gifuensis]|uniref:uncharacterized protein MAL13P1.304-like n=1 Tax=Aphidius gifuensis TaxID=684658 RepID=UPI001CDD1C67|nr:uncharacterized protein MAL13P1.304-like [Aphidius gifuensis]XP_044006259.1 uncharacterized protein MAL13P1.304-like [Aphidius gifuensis]
MAPRNMAALDCNRYLLRACKQQSTNGKIDASNITTKIEFLRFLGLTTSENINSNCEICRNNICKCSDSVTSDIEMANEYNNFTFKECWVVVASEKCTICRKIFKCQSDLDNHTRKKHKKISKKRTRIVLKIGHEVVTENYVKKRYLPLSNNDSKIISSEDKNISNNFDNISCENSLSEIIDTPTLEAPLNSDESSEDKRCASVIIKPTEFNYHRNCSASSSDTRVELFNCPDSCCREDETSQKHKDNINSEDQNNNNDSCCNNNNYLSEVDNDLSMNDDNFTNSNSSFTNNNTLSIDNNNTLSSNNNNSINDNCSSETEDIECCSRSVSVQTPSYWDYQTFTLLEYSRTLEANRMKDKSIIPAEINQEENIITIDDDIEVSILEDKFKKINDQSVNNLTKERDDFCSKENNDFSMEDNDHYQTKDSDNFSMDESDDDSEIQEISPTTQPLKQSLRITDAIKSLIDTENSMQDYEKLNNKKKYDDIDIDDDISYVRMQMQKEEIDCEYDSFDVSKLDQQIDDDDVSIVPLLDCEEKNYNICVNGDYDYVDYELASLKQLAKTKSINDEFDNESRSWEKPNRNRLSIQTRPIQFFNHNNSSILIKEEVSIDHFTFDRE